MVETKTYSAMLYALADEIRREEGCVTESPDLVEDAATRLDEQTVIINELRRQNSDLLASARTDCFPQAHRLAMELESLLLSCTDTAATAKWWGSANEALDQWREFNGEKI